jgi:RNA polymerase sigma-70 factor, ECF subfamily
VFRHSEPAPRQSAAEFQEIALPYLSAVYRFAWRLSRDASVAEDLTQETFLQAWRSFRRFERGTNCRAWLFGILCFVWSHERRRRGRERVVYDDTIVEAASPCSEPPIPDHLTDADVLAALDNLPHALRDTILLTDVEGFTYREVSNLLGIPLGTVMSRLNRGRRLLRAELSAHAEFRDRAVGWIREAGRARILAMTKGGR